MLLNGRIGVGISVSLWAGLVLCACLFETRPASIPEDLYFTRSIEGLAADHPTAPADLRNGDTLILTAAPVKKAIDGKWVRMTAFNGSVPGPAIRVRQGDSVTLVLRNRSGSPLTLHPHGIRLDYLFDGAPGFSQAPIDDGKEFAYKVRFPDAGAFWYHSHLREDAFQTLGLYGNFLVAPRDSAYWNPVDLEVPLIIGEVTLDPDGLAPIRKDRADHVMMGRFGNVFLANGDTDFAVTVKRNAYVRFYVTNACNARVLNFVTNQTYMKVVGSDNGKYETSYLAGSEFIAPGERLVFEAMFKKAGTFFLYHEMPDRFLKLGRVEVLDDSVTTDFHLAYARTDTAASVVKDIDAFRAAFPSSHKAPDKRLFFTGHMGGHDHLAMKAAASAHGPDGSLGIEWVDTMGAMNANSTAANMSWIIRDLETGLENHEILWNFKKGDQPLIRIVNDSNAVHSMPHPIHFHGQRFLVVAVNGKPNPLLAWKDTYLVPAGSTADLVLDASNPGGWMAHCHIAEHLAGDMMFHFRVNE